jgi:hypothetical protein
MMQTIEKAIPIPSMPTAFAWGMFPAHRQEVRYRWIRLSKRKGRGRGERLPTLRELNAWFDANRDQAMADAERAWSEATRAQ